MRAAEEIGRARKRERRRVENKNVGGCVRQLMASSGFFVALLTRFDTVLCARGRTGSLCGGGGSAL